MISEPPISADTIADSIRQLRRRVSTTEDELNRLHSELEWWETGQQLFAGEAPDEPPAELPLEEPKEQEGDETNGAIPSLRNRILAVLALEPRKTWKAEAIIDELRQRDWLPGGEYAEHHVRSMLAQMHKKGQARKMGRGVYRLPPERKGMSGTEFAGNVAAGVGTGLLLAKAAHSVIGGANSG